MIKELKYSGISAVPSDYECLDGDLAIAMNVLPENGDIRPLSPPTPILRLYKMGQSVRYIHKNSNYTHYIVFDDVTNAVYWMDETMIDPSSLETTNLITIPDVSANAINDIAAVGNTLVISTTSGLLYYLWKDNAYLNLGTRPPFVSIDFGLQYRGTLDITENKRDYGKLEPINDDTRRQRLKDITQHVYGLMLEAVDRLVNKKGYFYQPFFVRYAFRLYDGNYAWHSAPILMLPTVHVPIIKFKRSYELTDMMSDVHVINFSDIRYFQLEYRILNCDINKLKSWSDIIKGVDIFVSAPIYTYNQADDIKGIVPLSDLLTRLPYNNSYSSPLLGHYAIGTEHKDQIFTGDASTKVYDVPVNENFHDKIVSTSDFYKVSAIEIDDIETTAYFHPVIKKSKDLSSLVAFPRLQDDEKTHCLFAANKTFTYNSKLSIADITETLPQPVPIRSMLPFMATDAMKQYPYFIIVKCRKNGEIKTIASEAEQAALLSPTSLINPITDLTLPRYIFYPDNDATEMWIINNSNPSSMSGYCLKLKPHDFLNGSYFYSFSQDGYAATKVTHQQIVSLLSSIDSQVSYPNKIHSSEVNNPFIFPQSSSVTVGSGRVMGLSSAAKALSQGQFGQFPLYAFTDEGIWAIEVSSSGTYIARQPITRDVCYPDSITQIDSAVLFAAHRGIMLLSGSTTQCISDIIDTDFPLNILSLPHAETLINKSGIAIESLNILPFREFLSSCRMLYNYRMQQIVIYNANCRYAYVYSLKDKKWGMMQSNIINGVNSYPDTLAMDNNLQLINYSDPEPISLPGLIITRPINLSEPDILKTIRSIIQRGAFNPKSECINAALYGSLDLTHWHIVTSSYGHHLSNISGTPYKWFRLALLCKLQPHESLHGCTIQYAPRLTNKPR